MAYCENNFIVVDCFYRAQHIGSCHRQRFFAKNVFAGVRCSDDLICVLGMRRAQYNAVDFGVIEHRGKLRDDLDGMLAGEIRNARRIDLDDLVDADCFALLQQGHDRFPPPADTDHCNVKQ